MAFATIDDVEALCIGTLSATQEDQADALLEQAANKIRAYTGQTFDLTSTTDTLRAVGSIVRLPQRPVISVDSVQLIDTLGNTYALPVYGFDGIDRLDLAYYGQVLNLPEEIALDGGWAGTVKVTYQHGYSDVPADLQALNAELVARIFNAPTQGAVGIRSQSTGPYNVSYDPAYAGGVVILTDDDKVTLNRYRRNVRTMELRW